MRLAMYVDGWNFYWSLVEAGLQPYGWYDFPLLARQQTGQPDAEVSVKYFTSRDLPHRAKISDRQIPIWWRALELNSCRVIQGEFRPTDDEVEEQNRATARRWREKKTDVALACHMLVDASLITEDSTGGLLVWSPGYDHAVLVTQDADFVPLVRMVSAEPLHRPVLVLLPPSRPEAQENAQRVWNAEASRKVVVKQLRKLDLSKALLPEVVNGAGGQSVKCHPTWMSREKHQQTVAYAAPGRARVTQGQLSSKR